MAGYQVAGNRPPGNVTNTPAAESQQRSGSLVVRMAERWGIEGGQMWQILEEAVFPRTKDGKPWSKGQLMGFLAVCDEYNLNPITREIHAFPDKFGRIIPTVGIDGWVTMVNRHPMFDGQEFEMLYADDGKPIGCKCTMWRKDRTRPTVATEWVAECYRETEPWRLMPGRMIRHKAWKECARYCFGYAGILDFDDAESMGAIIETSARSVEPVKTFDQLAAGAPQASLAAPADSGVPFQGGSVPEATTAAKEPPKRGRPPKATAEPPKPDIPPEVPVEQYKDDPRFDGPPEGGAAADDMFGDQEWK